MTQKPFDPTKPVQTRDGRAARIIDTNFKCLQNKNYTLIVVITNNTNNESIHVFRSDGSYIDSKPDWNLINIPEKHVRWINFYNNAPCSLPYLSKEAANRGCGDLINRIACVRIEFTEGEGLN